MAFHHGAIEAEEHAAIGRARVHLGAQHLEGAACDGRAQHRDPRALERRLQIIGDEARGPFGGFERDVAREAVGHHDIDRAGADVVALDEALELNRQVRVAQHLGGELDVLVALHLFGANVQQGHQRRLHAEHDAGEGRAHDGEIDEMTRLGADIGADIENDGLAAHGGPQRGDSRALDAVERTELELGHGHERAGVAGRDGGGGLAILHGLDRPPHGRLAATAQRLAGLVVHAHHIGGRANFDDLDKPRLAGDQLFKLVLTSVQQKTRARMTDARNGDAVDHGTGGVVATHGVDRDDKRTGFGRISHGWAPVSGQAEAATTSRPS